MILALLGLGLLLGLVGARWVERASFPSITGFLLIGMLLGPILRVFPPHLSSQAAPLIDFALALIFFLVGQELQLNELRQIGGRAVLLTAVQLLLTGALVALAAGWLGLPVGWALVLGVVGSTTDPAAVSHVLQTSASSGPLTAALQKTLALGSVAGVLLFSLILPLVAPLDGHDLHVLVVLDILGRQLILSLLLGLALGAALHLWQAWTGHGPPRLPLLALLAIGAGLVSLWKLNLLLTAVAFGAYVVNRIPRDGTVFAAAEGFSSPFLAIFFVLAGSELQPGQLWLSGWLGLAYVGSRLVGKIAGGWLGGWLGRFGRPVRRYLGACLIPQAAVALGLITALSGQFPSLARQLSPLVLAGVVVFELVGPVTIHHSLRLAGELPEG